MTFWGVELKPAKPYTHRFDFSRGKLRITQATLGNGSGPRKSTVQCNVGNKKPVLLCTLLPDKVESCPLDLEFEEAEEVIFSVVGPRSVHLTGYSVGNGRALDGDETDPYGEDIAETGSDVSNSSDSEESYKDDFVDDGDIEMLSSPPSAKRHSGVIIEEISDDEEPAHGSGKPSSQRRKNQVGGSLSGGHNLLTGQASEDEDGLPIRFQRRNKNHRVNNVDDVEVIDIPDKAAQEKDTVIEGDINNCDHVKVVENNEKQSAHSHEGDITENGVSAKKKKRDKTRKGTTSEHSVGFSTDKNDASEETNEEDEEKGKTLVSVNQVNIVEDQEEHRLENNEASVANSGGKARGKNKTKKKRNKENTTDAVNEIHTEVSEDAGINVERSDAGGPKKKRKKVKSSDCLSENGTAEIKNEDIELQHTFPNGFIVEDIQMGKPDGERASIGKKVSVHYIGKLKDGKIFASSIKKRPKQFILGVGDVIKGLDLGVDGMRVGDKRRLTIPPSLAYGDEETDRVPPDSWLTFDVELVDVE